MPKRSKTEAAKSKVETATALSALGGAVGGPLGAGIGAVGGLIIGDRQIILPLDMIAIPAFDAYMIQGTPSMKLFLRAGETISPTGGNVKDVEDAIDELIDDMPSVGLPSNLKKPASKYQQAYKKNFHKVAEKYRTKSGRFKSGGFRKTVKEAHKVTKAQMSKSKK